MVASGRRGAAVLGVGAALAGTGRRGVAVLGVVALVASGVAGCGTEAGAVCGVVVDSTTYAEPATSRADVTSKLPEFVQGCDWVGFAAVTGASESSSCREDPVTVAAGRAENPNDNPVVEERVRAHRTKEVVPRAVRLFDCPTEGEGSDVLGALRYAVKQMTARRLPDREHRLIVFSDLSNNRGELNINRLDLAEEARKRKVEELRRAGLLPGMDGYAVTVHGFLRERTSDPDRFPSLEAFWREAFEAAGATSADLL
ncbi:vWA domain-containing protein [Nonomuraea sp. NPDC048826]|uniref:vWA domain-containing protein n=1 Tax=Nonomuraea sp. NPDC048826 TaxID=3364347 RepID=UPI0037211274